MEELLRLDYLAAMGITQYVARAPLPGALPSENITLVALAEIKQPQSITSLLDNEEPPPKITAQKILAVREEKKQHQTPTNHSVQVFHCQIAIWTIEDLLVLADTQQLDNAQLTLLRNIMLAIGRKQDLSPAKKFSWPLQQRKEKGLHPAREHFQGLLDEGMLKTPGLKQILCFGATADTLLRNNYDESNTTLKQYQDWPVISVCTLQDMLEQPSRKAETWRELQIMVRS